MHVLTIIIIVTTKKTTMSFYVSLWLTKQLVMNYSRKIIQIKVQLLIKIYLIFNQTSKGL